MAATFIMSFGGVDFRLSPSNRQAGISFQPPASSSLSNDDDLIVLRLESFTGTLQIKRSNMISAVSPRSDESTHSHHDECSNPTTTATTTFTSAVMEQEKNAAVAPANVTPKMSPRRPRSDSTVNRSSQDTTTSALKTNVMNGSPTLAEAAATSVFSPNVVEAAVQNNKNKNTAGERLPEECKSPTNQIHDTYKRPQAASSTLSSTENGTPQSKRTRYNKPKRSIAAIIAEGERRRLAGRSSTSSSTSSSIDGSTSHHSMVFLGQTPDFSQPSVCDDLLESGCSGCDDLPMMFDDSGTTSATNAAQPLVMTVDDTEQSMSATVQELLHQASNSTNSMQGTDEDDAVEANDEQEKDFEEKHMVEYGEPAESNPDMQMEAIKEDAEFVGWYNGEETFLRRPKLNEPLPRWGQTMTKIGENQILLYGGQAFESASFPTTLSDVHVYDLVQRAWHQPVNCDGMPRQWHTATYLPKRQLLISFGGESADPVTKKITTTDQVMVLDTEIMLWYPPTVTGTAPSGRSGHSATLFNSGNDLVVFGGVKGAKWLNSVSVLDTMRWRWTSPKIAGAAPKPRSYHSATAICRGKKNRLVIFGGNNADSSFDGVHVLENEDKTWRWFHPTIRGTGPAPRTGHTATLLEDNKTILIYGGWDVNMSDEDTIFGDSFLLDTETWAWRQGPQPCFPVVSDVTAYEREGEKRVGHSAVLVQGQDCPEVLVFGGRIPNDKFCNDFQRISLQEHVVGTED